MCRGIRTVVVVLATLVLSPMALTELAAQESNFNVAADGLASGLSVVPREPHRPLIEATLAKIERIVVFVDHSPPDRKRSDHPCSAAVQQNSTPAGRFCGCSTLPLSPRGPVARACTST